MPRPKPKKADRDRKTTTPAAKPAPPKEQPVSKAAAQAAAQATSLETLEAERAKVLKQLRGVEEQVFKLETAYFQNADPQGNALIGYSGLLEHPPETKKRRTDPVLDEERMFSGSSVTGAC